MGSRSDRQAWSPGLSAEQLLAANVNSEPDVKDSGFRKAGLLVEVMASGAHREGTKV